jgi:type IV pilus assembly protein PilY1
MEIDALTGNRLNETAFDLSGNGVINAEDMVKLVDTDNNGSVNSNDALTSASGKKSTTGIIKSPGVVSAGTTEYKYTSGSSGLLESTQESTAGGGGRKSWRQLR